MPSQHAVLVLQLSLVGGGVTTDGLDVVVEEGHGGFENVGQGLQSGKQLCGVSQNKMPLLKYIQGETTDPPYH